MKVVILAVSKKKGGWCVVGKNIENLQQWIRLVGDKNGRELYDREITINDGTRNRLLKTQDVIDVELGEDCPLPYQPENKLYKTIQFVKRLDCIDEKYLDSTGMIFGNKYAYVYADETCKRSSVVLVKVSNLTIEYNEPSGENVKPKTFANFKYGWFNYENLRVTDPFYRATESIGEAFVCVSLGEPFNPIENGEKKWPNDRHYKIVAAVYR